MLRTCPRCGGEYGTEWRQGAERDILCRCHWRLLYALGLTILVAIVFGFCVGKCFPPKDKALPKKMYQEANSRARKMVAGRSLIAYEEDIIRITTGEERREK